MRVVGHRVVVAVLASLLGTVVAAAVPAGVAGADDTKDFSLSVSPPRVVIDSDALDDEVELRLTNRGREAVDVVVQRRPMRANVDGTVGFYAEATYSAAGWISTDPEQFRIEPQQSTQVRVRVQLPERYEPGDHHVALVFLVPGNEGEAGIQLTRGLGVPVYIQAPGEVDRTVHLVDLQAPRFSVSGPVEFTASLQHVGTVHRDFREDDVLAVDVGEHTVPLPEFSMLRDTERQVVARWDDPPLMCICQASLAVPLPDGTMQRVDTTVVIFPFHVVGGALLLVTLLLGVLLVRRVRRTRTAAPAASSPVGGVAPGNQG